MLSPPLKVPRDFSPPVPPWRVFVRLPEEDQNEVDIAFMNLALARGLPGAGEIDVWNCIRILHSWTDRVRSVTEQGLRQFRRDPSRYENSEAYFRALCLVTVLQRDIGVRYNPAKIPREVAFTPADSFIHGAIIGEGGTCASLPVLFAAVGRPLGYPIKIVSTYVDSGITHCFARWDDPEKGERFNFETTGRGLARLSDDHYRTGKYQLTPDLERAGCYMRSKTPREELASFLTLRGSYLWHDPRHRAEGNEAALWAVALAPDNVLYKHLLHYSLDQWRASLVEMMPRQLPPGIRTDWPCELFPPTAPRPFVEDFLRLVTMDRLLRNPELVPQWEQMRRGVWEGPVPRSISAKYRMDMSCDITVAS